MIITCGGTKGGSGKSTLATNLAVLASTKWPDVLLVDGDDQESSADFTAMRNEVREGGAGYTCVRLTGRAVLTEAKRLAPKYDHVIIDTGGRDTTSQRAALAVCDVLLVPFIPRSFDVWTLGKISALVEEMRTANPDLRAYAFINRADPRGHDNDEAAELIRETESLDFISTPLGSRKAFANAAARGLAVTELRPTDEKAVSEMTTLFQLVFSTKTVPQQVGV